MEVIWVLLAVIAYLSAGMLLGGRESREHRRAYKFDLCSTEIGLIVLLWPLFYLILSLVHGLTALGKIALWVTRRG